MGKNREQQKAKRKEKRSSGEVYSQKHIRLKQAQIEAQQERPIPPATKHKHKK